MDSLIAAAGRALTAGDVLGALKHVGWREDPAALALRGIAMAQLGQLDTARDLLRRARRAFGPHETVARARCLVAEAEVALAMRELGDALWARIGVEPSGEAFNSIAFDERNNRPFNPMVNAGAIAATTLLLSACAGSNFRPVSDIPVRIGPAYSIRGTTYVPAAAPAYDALGYASWYGSESGNRTANGEKFRPGWVTAAHTTLPLPTYVEVTALDTGRTILVRINDRGPMANDQLIALSPAAAEILLPTAWKCPINDATPL